MDADGDDEDGHVLDRAHRRCRSSVDSGPAGTTFTIHLKGVGWTETANIYAVDYDNAYIGYACGFNSQGDVMINLQATGEPGWHFIDLYPADLQGQGGAAEQFPPAAAHLCRAIIRARTCRDSASPSR